MYEKCKQLTIKAEVSCFFVLFSLSLIYLGGLLPCASLYRYTRLQK